MALAALTVDDVDTGGGEGEHVGEEFWGILEVGVEDEDVLSAGGAESGGECELVPVVAGKF